jgi:hypothetical protein
MVPYIIKMTYRMQKLLGNIPRCHRPDQPKPDAIIIRNDSGDKGNTVEI